MMRSEFEQLTGIYPTVELYQEIEKLYNDFDGDKQAFCKAFKKNKNGLAEIAQERAVNAKWANLTAQEKERAEQKKREDDLRDGYTRMYRELQTRSEEFGRREEEIRRAYEKKCEELEAVRKELNELKAGLSAMKALFTKIS